MGHCARPRLHGQHRVMTLRLAILAAVLLTACDSTPGEGIARPVGQKEPVTEFKPDPNPKVAAPAATSDQLPPGHPARAAAELMLRDVSITSGDPFAVSWRGCSKNDALIYSAEGTNAAGNRVKVVVYCGWLLRGCTVRVPQ